MWILVIQIWIETVINVIEHGLLVLYDSAAAAAAADKFIIKIRHFPSIFTTMSVQMLAVKREYLYEQLWSNWTLIWNGNWFFPLLGILKWLPKVRKLKLVLWQLSLGQGLSRRNCYCSSRYTPNKSQNFILFQRVVVVPCWSSSVCAWRTKQAQSLWCA